MAYQILISRKTKSNAIRVRCYTSTQPRRSTLGGFRHLLYKYRQIENDFNNIETQSDSSLHQFLKIFFENNANHYTRYPSSITTNRQEKPYIYNTTSSFVYLCHNSDVTRRWD